MLCLESSDCKKDNKGEMTRRLPKSSHHDIRAKRADPASWLAAMSWTGLGHHSTEEHPARHRDPKSPTHHCGSPAFSLWRQYLEPGQPWDKLSSLGAGQSCKEQEAGAGDQGQLLVGSGAWRAAGSEVAHMGGNCY